MKDDILAEFEDYGKTASFHYADDTGHEWQMAYAAEKKARALFEAHPELQCEMRQIASGFLWIL